MKKDTQTTVERAPNLDSLQLIVSTNINTYHFTIFDATVIYLITTLDT